MLIPQKTAFENYENIANILNDLEKDKNQYYTNDEKIKILRDKGFRLGDYEDVLKFFNKNLYELEKKFNTENNNTPEACQFVLNNYNEIRNSLIKYVWLENVGVFYHIESGNQHEKGQVAINLEIDQKEIKYLIGNDIPRYKELCYSGKQHEDMFNLLNMKDILSKSDSYNEESIKNIKIFIRNLFGNNDINEEWFEKALLYKYNNLDDVLIPAVIIHGNGGTGKDTLINFLGKIFGQNNIQRNLGQSALSGQFDIYTGRKLIVHFNEISNFNTNSDKGILNRLKNLIGSNEITVNRKYAASYTINNNAWFFITGNNDKPIMLDREDRGNRRFTIIKTGEPLKDIIGLDKLGDFIEDILKEDNIRQYLRYLDDKYGKVDRPISLVNDDIKKLLDDNKSEQEIFFESIWQEFSGQKVDSSEISRRAELYCNKEGLNHNQFMRYVRNDLPFFVERKQFRLDGKKIFGYVFNKYDGRFDNLETLDKKIYIENV